jgi:hypothetical protein
MLSENIKTNAKEIKNLVISMPGRKIILFVGVVSIGLLIFHAGVVVGYHRSSRGHAAGEYGFRPVPGLASVRVPAGFIAGDHGAVGVVSNMNGSTFTVRMRDGSTQTVSVNGTTIIRTMRGSASTSAIGDGDEIVVVGAPSDTDDAISADLIRIMQEASHPLR